MAPKALALFLAINLFVLGTMPADATTCPLNTLDVNVCVNALNLVQLYVGCPAVRPCCSLVQGLVAADAKACLCTVINGGILGIIPLTVPVDITLLLNSCGYSGTYSC
ncbi:unnamed protein product [Urochloa decumbens]|uniref:Bifunctional inhibitor/plant lipid transfer protein/seed storage helical domain-containing protein n=1 Tax=Urochloa decumbens TaxID=240449 RepID=A0ABC8V929_9POAL